MFNEVCAGGLWSWLNSPEQYHLHSFFWEDSVARGVLHRCRKAGGPQPRVQLRVFRLFRCSVSYGQSQLVTRRIGTSLLAFKCPAQTVVLLRSEEHTSE